MLNGLWFYAAYLANSVDGWLNNRFFSVSLNIVWGLILQRYLSFWVLISLYGLRTQNDILATSVEGLGEYSDISINVSCMEFHDSWKFMLVDFMYECLLFVHHHWYWSTTISASAIGEWLIRGSNLSERHRTTNAWTEWWHWYLDPGSNRDDLAVTRF